MLERMTRSVAESYGLVHQLNLRALRSYIKVTQEEDLINQINEIKEVVLLRTLWEAGLRQGLQDAVLDRMAKLT
uniref:Uncharacterized protein n=1 Tax=viral metagenome TaxID=1070528 RepID=A0A6H2A3G2_9ZZZZ